MQNIFVEVDPFTDDKFQTVKCRQKECHKGPIWCCCFTDQKHLVTGSADETVKLWSIENDETELFELTRLSGHSLGVADVDVFDCLLIASSLDGYLRIWDLNSEQIVQTIPKECGEEGSNTWMCSLSPDGKVVATGGNDCVDLYSLQSKTKVASLPAKHKYVINIASSPCGQYLAASTNSGTVLLFDMCKLQILKTFEHHALPVRALEFSSDCKILATGADDGIIKLHYDYSSSEDTNVSTLFNDEGWILSLHLCNEYLACGSTLKSVRSWNLLSSNYISDDDFNSTDIESKRIFRQLHDGLVWGVRFDRDCSILASVGSDQAISLIV